MAHELRTRARSSGRAAVERRTAFIGPTPPASERVPPRMWCTVNHLGMMTYSGRSDAECTADYQTGEARSGNGLEPLGGSKVIW